MFLQHLRIRSFLLLLLPVSLVGCLGGSGGFEDLVSGSLDDVDELQIDSVLPDVNSLIIQQGQSQSFFVSAKAPIGRTLSYLWKLDGTQIATGSNHTLSASISNVGTRTLVVEVSDGVASKFKTWSVKINGPPEITKVTTGTPKVAVGSDINMIATATDPNSDTLTYTWKLNGVTSPYLVGSTGTATLSGHADVVGSVNISLEVSDGSASDTESWTAEVNYFPQACNTLSQGNICTISGSPSIGDGTQPGISTVEVKMKPIAHAQDALGNLFVADWQNNIIWYWNRTGSAVNRLGVTVPALTIKVVAGSGEAATGADGAALESAINGPRGLYYHDAGGKLYISEYNASRVRYVDNTGYIYTGMGGGSSHVNGVAAYNHACSNPSGITFYNDNIYVACRGSHRVKRWDISTDLAYVAVGNGGSSFANGAATSVNAGYPYSLFVNADGIFVSHREIDRISFTNHSGASKTFWNGGGGPVTIADGNIGLLVGTGSGGNDTNTAPTAGKIGNPTGLAYMNDVLFFTQLDNEYLYAVNNSAADTSIDGVTVGRGKLVRLTAAGTYNGSGVRIASSKFYDPYDLSIDVLNPTSQLIVSDYNNNLMRRVSFSDAKVFDLLGSGKNRAGFYGDTAKPTMEHLFNRVVSVAYDNLSKTIFFADASNHRIRGTDQYGQTSTVLSRGGGDPTIDNDVPSNSYLRIQWSTNWYLSGLGLLPDSSLLIANTGSNNIRIWNRSGDAKTYNDVFLQNDRVSNLAGNYLSSGNGGDGPGITISLDSPSAAKYNPVDGQTYIVDQDNHCIRSLDSSGNMTRVLGTCGTSGISLTNVAEASLLMNHPTDIDFDSHGNMVITDRSNHRIRYWNKSAAAVTIGSVTIDPGRVSIIACLNGNAASGSLNEGILATSARCNNPTGIAVNDSNICFSNTSYHNVRCISLASDATQGRIYTKAGNPPALARAGSPYGFEHEGVPGTSALLYYPIGVAFDADGDLYIADSSNHIVRKVKISP